tara:strand:+ start:754 stop:1605 length:852 start_codon:yes stop_codon:yes gene_type:complete
MSTLLIGSTGYIGKIFADKLDNHEALSYKDVSVQSLLNKFTSMQFDNIINCAGFVGRPSVDAVENHKEEAVHGNIILPSILVEFGNIIKNVKILHVSTGCCFDSTEPLDESVSPNLDWNSKSKCNFYAGTKSMSEKIVARFPQHYICRLRMPFDNKDGDRNLISKLLKYENVLSVKNSLTHRGEFVDACLHLLENECEYGIYNIVNSGAITSQRIIELASKYAPSLVENTPVKRFYENIDEFYKKVNCGPRSNCILSNKKILDAGFEMRGVEDALIDSLKNWQ